MKPKTGKHRKDKYYHLAKETGYRSRAAFKLLQLNRKYEFLQRSRVLIDLCAAPGGWLQVASEHMPISSIILGIDLVPIKPIPRVTCIQDDITKESCDAAIKRELKTWKADVVLHDGAPNVGKNWIHDAFQQAQLALSSLKLATNFLMKGGWFVTKIFRSKDYNSLLWVFKQLFKKVYATKPQASRNESAEIFVVCQSYLAPDKIDPKLLNPKFVFSDVDPEPENKINILHPDKKKKHALGYPEGDYTLYHRVNVSEFIQAEDSEQILSKCSELVFDDDNILNHPLTTPEIKECCKDVKVLGRREFRELLRWKKKVKQELFTPKKDGSEKVDEEIDSDEDEETKHQKHAAQLQEEEAKGLKRQKKKVLKGRRKAQERMDLKIDSALNEPIVEVDSSLFKLSTIKNKKELRKVEATNMAVLDTDPHLMGTKKKKDEKKLKQNYELYDRHDRSELMEEDEFNEDSDDDDRSISSLEEYGADEDDIDKESMSGEVDDVIDNPLMVDLDNPTVTDRKNQRTNMWFDKEIFAGLEGEADEDAEIDESSMRSLVKLQQTKQEDVVVTETKDSGVDSSASEDEDDDEEEEDDDSSDSDGSDYDVNTVIATRKPAPIGDIEVVPQEQPGKKKRKLKLDPEGLALATMLIQSKKMKRDIMDNAWNRYASEDGDILPDWFVKEERMHNRKRMPVTKEMVDDYKEQLKEINVRSIKKVAEAKGRKKRRAAKKFEKARKKAEAVMDSADMSEHEKVSQLKSIYKKAEKGSKKKDVTYCVSKKGLAGKKIVRPKGLQGRMKLVDPRLKKDNRKKKMTDKMNKRKGKGKPKGNNRSKQSRGRQQ